MELQFSIENTKKIPLEFASPELYLSNNCVESVNSLIKSLIPFNAPTGIESFIRIIKELLMYLDIGQKLKQNDKFRTKRKLNKMKDIRSYGSNRIY